MSMPPFARAARTTEVGDTRAPRMSRTVDALEAVGVFVLILIHIWWMGRHFRPAWLAIVAIAAYSHWRRRESLAWLGFRTNNFLRCVRDFGPLVVGLAVVPLALGISLDTLRPWPALTIVRFVGYYCLWGLFQQYALNGFFVNRLRVAAGASEQRWVPLLAATLFSTVHAPNWFLVGVTFTLGLICARIYLTYRNLFFLGISHGIIGSALYMSVPDWIGLRFYIGPRALHY